MKLFVILSAVLALSLAEEIDKDVSQDLEASASMELLKTSFAPQENLDTAASFYSSANYVPPSQRPPRPWSPPANQQNYNNPTYTPNQQNWNKPQNDVPAVYPPQNNNYNQNQNYPTVPLQHIPAQPFPANNFVVQAPANNYVPQVPANNYVPQTVPQAPQNNVPANPQAPQNDYYYPQYPAVIKNDQYFGTNGDYKYEYQIADGTHVGESGYLVNPNTDNESVVKKGWYSYTGADGRVYTVTWWADDSGYHAFGDHLPTPPPVPPAIQQALDQAAEAEKNKPQQPPVYYPTTSAPGYYPTTPAPAYYPTNPPAYYPPKQPAYYPNNNYQGNYGK